MSHTKMTSTSFDWLKFCKILLLSHLANGRQIQIILNQLNGATPSLQKNMTIQSANYLCIWLWASIPRCHTFPGSWDGGRTLGPEARDARSCHAVPCPERQVTQWFSTFLAWRNSFWDEHLHALQQVLDNLFILALSPWC